MRRFAALYDALDATTSTNAKVAAMRAYFAEAPPADAAWALYFLSGRRVKRTLAPRLLAAWAQERTGTPGWLLEECYGSTGDLAETIALLLDHPQLPGFEELPLSRWLEERLLPLRTASEEEKRSAILAIWDGLDRKQIFLVNKLVTGELRVGVSATLAVRALAQHAGLEPAVVAHRLMGSWEPSAQSFAELIAPGAASDDLSRPYPFFLASTLAEPAGLAALGRGRASPSPARGTGAVGEYANALLPGPREEFLAEWKWDGIRAQLVRRGGQQWLWSRGEELITERFPDLLEPLRALPEGLVLDGEVLAFRDGAPLGFSVLQTRIGRQKLSAKALASAPARLMAFDLLEENGEDLRALPLRERRARLLSLAQQTGLLVSAEVEAASWEELMKLREGSRERGVEGLMLKRWDSPYRTGRPRGDWWKYKIDPYSIDAVLVYAQPGSGRRATLLTDLTFALWSSGELVPVAKAYSGLTDEEIDRLDGWIRQNTIERFGPVRHVPPVQVFELHFEGIARSPRHKSGLAVRFPRIARWRTDKRAEEADTVETLRALSKE